MNDAEIRLQVKIDESGASKSIDNLASKAKDLSNSFKNVGSKMTVGLTAPIIGFFGLAIKGASDLEETMNKVDVTFGDSADEVKKWAETTIDQFGIAKGTALDMTALFGDMATGMGVNQTEAAKLGTNLTGLAGDLASFKNVRLDVAKTALAGVFTGETESLKQLGIIMTVTNLEQFALTQGIKKSYEEMTEAEKIQLRYAFIVDRSKNSVGDYARTSDSTANQTREAQERFKELTATLGDQLIPIFNDVLEKVNGLFTWFGNLDEKQQGLILTILGVVAAIGPILMIIGSLIGFITTLTAATWLWNGALLANPITWIVLGIIALIAVIIMVIVYFDEIKWFLGELWKYWAKVFSDMWTKVKDIFTKVKNFIGGVFKSIGNFFISMINGMIKNLNWMIKAYLTPINALIKGLNIPLKALGLKTISTIKIAIPEIPALATGTNNVQRDGLAYLHQGEAVVPKKYNPAMGGFNGNNVIQLNNMMTLDGRVVYENQQSIIGNKTLQTGFGG
jgi:hypothetical protein